MERIIKCVSIVIHNVKVGSKILDIGCGSGLFGEILAKKGYKVYGIDVLPCKDECLRKGYIDVKESIDVNYGIPYNDEFFDLVFCGEIIEHIWDTTFFLCEVNRVLLNDGYILLTTPNLATIANLPRLILGQQLYPVEYARDKKWQQCSDQHLTYYSPNSLKHQLISTGFSNIHFYGYAKYDKHLIRRIIYKILSLFPTHSSELIVLAKKKKEYTIKA